MKQNRYMANGFMIQLINLKLVTSVFVGLFCFDLTASLLYGAKQEQNDLTIRQRALKQFDADEDGRLNAVERETLRKAGSPFAVKRPRFIRNRRRHEQRIKKYDKDGDGELSQEEEKAARQALENVWSRLVGEYKAFVDDRPIAENLQKMQQDAKRGKIKDFPEELYDWIRGSINRARGNKQTKRTRKNEKPPSNHLLARFDIDRNGRLDPTELKEARITVADQSNNDLSQVSQPKSQPESSPIVELQSTGRSRLRITEFMTDNETGLVDEEGELVDWIEIHNHSRQKQSLENWSLTDSKKDSRRWVFPDIRLGAGEYLIVFASGKDRRRTDRPLHTNFQLKKGGEYLSLTSPDGEKSEIIKTKYPKQKTNVSFGFPLTAGGSEGESLDFLAFPTPGRRNAATLVGALSTIELSQPHGLFKMPFMLKVSTVDSDVTIRYTMDGSRPNESSPVLDQSLEIEQTTIIRARGYKPGYSPTPIVTRSYIFPADRINDSADGLPPADYPYEWGEGKSNYGMDVDIINNPKYRKKLLDALWAIPSYSIAIEPENLFSDESGIYAHAGWHGRKAERNCSLELLPTDDGQERGFQINAGVRMRGGFSRQPKVPKHGFRFFFRRRYGPAQLEYDLFGGNAAKEFSHVDLRCSQNYAWHHGFSSKALYMRDQLNRDLQFAMGHPSPRGNFRHLYINGHYWGLYNTCERPKAFFGESYIGGKKEDFDVVKIMGGYSEDEDQDRRYQVFATDGNMKLWTRLDKLSQHDLSDFNNYCQMIGVKPDGSRDPESNRLLDPVNLIDYMLVIFYGGNLDAPISWFGNNRGGNNWHGLMNGTQNKGFRFIIWDSEHTLLDIQEDRLGPFPLGDTADRSNPHWLYQRLLENEEFRVLLADRISKYFFHGGALTPKRLTELFDRRIAEIEPALFAEAARWGNPRKTYEAVLTDSEWRVEPHNSGVAKHQAWFAEVDRTRNQYIPRRTQVVINQLFGRGLYPDLPEIAVRWPEGGNRELELMADGFEIYYTTTGQDPRMFGGDVHSAAHLYEEPLTIVDGGRVLCRILEDGEWGPLREIRPNESNTESQRTWRSGGSGL